MRAYMAGVAVLVVALGALFVVTGWQRSKLRQLGEVTPAAPTIAPAVPLPIAAPAPDRMWVGPEGDDAYGYPRRSVDQVALLDAVRVGQFERAEATFGAIQAAYEQDYRKEHWPLGAVAAFSTADPALTAALEAWLTAHPKSYAAYGSRAAHRIAIAWAQRGHKYARETGEAQWEGFDQSMRLAAEDAAQAMRLNPRFLPSYALLVRIAGADQGATESRDVWLDRSLLACPLCTSVRATFLHFERMEWGGTPSSFAVALKHWQGDIQKNPRLAQLVAYGHEARCDALARADKNEEALAECSMAVQKGPALAEMWISRSRFHRFFKRIPEALSDLDMARSLDPQDRDMLRKRSILLFESKRYREAVDDLLLARRLDPVDVDLAEASADLVKRLVYDAWQLSEAHDTAQALKVMDMALELDPQNADARKRRVYLTGTVDNASQAEALEQAIAKNPDDFGLCRQLDDVYFRERRFDDIVAMWTKFLSRHPDHALAYWERAGTYHHKGDKARSMADARQACRLGVAQACAVAGSQ